MARVDTHQGAELVHWVSDRSDPQLRPACGAGDGLSPLRALRGNLVNCQACLEIMRRAETEPDARGYA
jgi:hypothetical protein